MRIRGWFVPVVFAMLILLNVVAPNPHAQGTTDLTGQYTAAGIAEDGPYTAVVTMHQRGQVVLIHWRVDGPEGATQTGFGFIKGSQLVVGIGFMNTGIGAAYTIKGDTLEGEWADPFSDPPTVRTETLTRVKTA